MPRVTKSRWPCSHFLLLLLSVFCSTFFTLCSVPDYPATVAMRRNNHLAKNRFTPVLAFDHSRVPLSTKQGDDYINASFLEGHAVINRYIATQG